MPRTNTRKECYFCKKHLTQVDYKDVGLLQKYVSHWSRIEAAKKSGACLKHQRLISQAIKRARHLALLPFTTK